MVAQAPERLDGLTAMRFVAALWVLLLHFRDNLAFDIDRATLLFRNGVMGVDFFFVLSGFVLAHVYFGQLDRFDYRGFLVKRLARVYPMHLVTLLGMVALAVATMAVGIRPEDPKLFDFTQIPAQLALVHAWGIVDRFAFNAPSWSISAEWAAYLLFPIIAGLLRKPSPRMAFALATAALCAVWAAVWLITGRSLTEYQHFGNIRILPEFALGIALWRVRPAKSSPWLVALGVIVVIASLHDSGSRFTAFWGLALIIWAGCRLHAPVWWVLLGEASYSLYMIHDPIQIVLFNGLQAAGIAFSPIASAGVVLSAIAFCVLASVACYRWIEIPARDRINLAFKERRSARASGFIE